MKKYMKILLTSLLLLWLPLNVYAKDTTVIFKNANLEKLIRSKLNKSNGTITQNELLKIKDLITYQKWDIDSLEGIEKLPNLEQLIIHFNNIKDLTPLKSLKKLKRFEIYANPIEDISPLGSIKTLEWVCLSNSRNIKDISSLRNLVKLKHLSLGGNKIEDISSLANLTNLMELFLEYNQIKDISSLKSLTKLMTLSLETNKIKDITPLSNLKRLYSLDIANNEVEDINAISNHTKLSSLYMSNNKVKNYEAISPYYSRLVEKDFELNEEYYNIPIIIEDLNLEKVIRNELQKPTGILTSSDANRVNKLEASGQGIKSIKGLEKFSNLTTLNLSNNQIKDIMPIQYLYNLRTLYLKGNPIKDYTLSKGYYRALCYKDFDIKLKILKETTVNNYDDMYNIIERSLFQKGQPITLKIKDPSLRNGDTILTMMNMVTHGHPEIFSKYKYISKNQMAHTQMSNSYYAKKPDYSEVVISFEETYDQLEPIDFSKYEKPSI